jgi:hypothetical protein
MSSLSGILSPKPIIIFLVLYSLLFIYGLWERAPDIDDAWIGEHAYWMAKDGYVHSELMRGVGGQENQMVIHHKLFTLQGALFIKLFGFSLYTLKSVSLIYFMIFIVLFYFYTVKYKKLLQLKHFLFALIIIFVFPFTFKYSFIYRPEMMMMAVGFAGYILLEKYIENEHKSRWKLFFAGLLFGLSVATHLNGLIFVISGLLLLAWNRKYRGLFIYITGSIVGIAPYFYDMTNLGDFILWRQQIVNNPAIDSLTVIPYWLKPVVNLLNEHMRYFHNLEIIPFSVFLIITILIGFRFLYRNHSNLVRFAFLIALFTGIIAPHKSRQYLLFNFPYYVLVIALVYKNIQQIKPRFDNKIIHVNPLLVRNIFFSFFLIFVTVSTYYNIHLSTIKFNPKSNLRLSQKYTDGNVSKMNVVAPLTFIFNEIKNYHRIQGDVCYAELQKSDLSIKGEGFLRKANSFNADLIMISPFYMPILKVDKFKPGDTIAEYRVVDKSPDLMVFKHLAD